MGNLRSNNPETAGEPNVQFKYEVTADRVGKPLDFTISYREGGVTVDLFLFATRADLMTNYTQVELDGVLFGASPAPSLTVSRAGNNVTLSWPASATGYGLESTSTLSQPSWTAVTAAPVVTGGQNSVTVDGSSGARYYRLRKP